MILVDGAGVLALLRDEPGADALAALLGRDEEVRLSGPGAAVVLDVLVRELGADEDEALLDLAELGVLPALPLDGDVALRAGLIRSRHHRKSSPLELVAAIDLALAARLGAKLATAAPALRAIAHLEGVTTLPLG